METYITTGDKTLCSGCRACEHICPTHAIAMVSDDEGFAYPAIHAGKCIDCRVCQVVCPMTAKQPERNLVQQAYAAVNPDANTLLSSSSGGVFSALSEYVLSMNGAVAGARLDSALNLKHEMVFDREGLGGLRGSKYLQSDTGECYPQIRDLLSQGVRVLFCGTPCQVAGLRAFLQANPDGLLTVDLICHGVPSPTIFKDYVGYLEHTRGCRITDYRFRDKRSGTIGHVESYLETRADTPRRVFRIPHQSPFIYGFLRGMLNRPCCYVCPFASLNRQGDITLGDYWRVQDYHRNLPAIRGVSAVIVNTEKGIRVFESTAAGLYAVETDVANIAAANPSLENRTGKHPYRDLIYAMLGTHGFGDVVKRYLEPKDKLIRILLSRLRRRLKQPVLGDWGQN